MLVSVLFRLVSLDNIPGLNADEAAMLVYIRDYLAGVPSKSVFMTDTHRFMGFYSIPAIAVEMLSPVSRVWVLRVLGAVFGLMLVWAGVYTSRRLFQRPVVALSTALLIACLPVHLAYSRVGWDPAQTTLATIFIAYFLLRGAWLQACVAGVIGLMIHPLAIFLAPAGALAVVFDAIPNSRLSRQHRSALIALLGIAATACVVVLSQTYLKSRPGVSMQALSIGSLSNHVAQVMHLFSGESSYADFSGATLGPLHTCLFMLGAALVLCLPLAAWHLARKSTLPGRVRWFGVGCIAGLLCFHMTGPSYDPGTERYLLQFTVPVIFTIALGADRLKWSDTTVAAAAGLLCTALMLGFYVAYFHATYHPMQTSSKIYRTGPEDIKQQAFDWLMADGAAEAAAHKQPVTIITDGWYLYWPMRYFANGQAAFRVYYIANNEAPMPPQDKVTTVPQIEALGAKGAYAVGWSDGPLARLAKQTHGLNICKEQTFNGWANFSVITAWRYCPPT